MTRPLLQKSIPLKECGACYYKRIPDGGHCYVFKEDPPGLYCAQFKSDKESRYTASPEGSKDG